MIGAAGKRLIDFDEGDYRRYAPLLLGVRDPFSLTVSELFLTYHQRRLRNEFLQWRAERKDAAERSLSDEEFVAHFGPPPWELLNETLAIVGLDYAFEPPIGVEDDLQYEARLAHEDGAVVTLSQLSSGEKTLMAIAMTLYTGSRLGEAIELPKVLLLDETDASLHPSMVISLLRVIEEIFTKRYGVMVILTTHSPTTVALAPEQSLCIMQRRGHPRLRPASRDEALQMLTVGVPAMSISVDNRRPVFVESEYDEACYSEFYRLLKDRLNSPLTLQFIASGRGGQGNADAVKHLVTCLRSAGSRGVLGVVDRDSRQGAPEAIHYVATRYALENLALDPLVLGAFLLREQFVTMREVGLPESLRHYQLDEGHAQPIIDFVATQVDAHGDDASPATVSYVGGFSALAPRYWLDINGHTLEERILAAFPALNRYSRDLKRAVVERAVGDLPNFAPADVLTLFRELHDFDA